jgi:DNA-directed RNA polymerase alpha subunit
MSEASFEPEKAIELLSNRLTNSGCSQCGDHALENLNFFHPLWHPVKKFYEMLNEDKFKSLGELENYIEDSKFDVMCSTCLKEILSI